ncbi:MAG: hypothetical protein ACPG49_12825 [Chitinophagales bacterium]
MNYFKYFFLLIIGFVLFILIDLKLQEVKYNSHKPIDFSSECSFMIREHYIMNGVIYMNDEHAMIRAFSENNKGIFNEMDWGDRLFKEANSNTVYLIEEFDSTKYYFIKEGD